MGDVKCGVSVSVNGYMYVNTRLSVKIGVSVIRVFAQDKVLGWGGGGGGELNITLVVGCSE